MKFNAFTKWLIISIFGIISMFCAVLIGFPFGLPMLILGTFLLFLPLLQIIKTLRDKGLLPLFARLGPLEKLVILLDGMGGLGITVSNSKHKGLLYKKGIGFIDDKGSQLNWGGTPTTIAMPNNGVGMNIPIAQYCAELHDKHDIRDYDDAIKRYLGPVKYSDFVENYRRNQIPDIYDINAELQYLIDLDNPHDPLSERVFGQTINFKHFGQYLKYAYNPTTVTNAFNNEMIRMKESERSYIKKDASRAMEYAKAFVTVMGIIIVLIIILANVDLSGIGNLFGGMFGG